MLGLATSLPSDVRSSLPCVHWREDGPAVSGCGQSEASSRGRSARENKPHYRASVRELAEQLQPDRRRSALLSRLQTRHPGLAARWVGIPVVGVSRGWTAATLKVRINEGLDRISLRRMDRVVCVSEGRRVKVRRAGVPELLGSS